MDTGLLARIGNAVWVATLAMFASLVVVTLTAAWSSAARVIRDNEPVGQTASWYRLFRANLSGTRMLSVAVVCLALIATVDVSYALLLDSGPVRYATLGAGIAIAVVLLAVFPHLAQQDFGMQIGVPARVRAATALAGVRPLLTAVLVFGGVLAFAACFVLAPLTPLFLALHLLLGIRVHHAVLSSARHRITV